MKIRSLQISNILSFKYYDDVSQAPKITFDDGLNILIGQNGAGKSTALEVINLIFKRVLLVPFNLNQDLYTSRGVIPSDQRRQILAPINNDPSYSEFRLDPNWNTENQSQKIRLEIVFDEIDKANLELLKMHQEKLLPLLKNYTQINTLSFESSAESFVVEIELLKDGRKLRIAPNADPGYDYLVKYKLYREIINLYNSENPKDSIPPLYESFTLIGGYRNYHSFTPNVALGGQTASQQIQNIHNQEYSRSTNANEQQEPSIFNLVRLRLAEKHYNLYGTKLDKDEVEQKANEEAFLKSINDKLKLVSLKVGIKFSDQRTWAYSFSFLDTRRNKALHDINSLSAGQKAIIHLVFEAYGRGELKGGVVIIDEPEIHLHYQFQDEYLRVIESINREHKCQYILVTHSESLINSNTIGKVKRLALDGDNYTSIKSPDINPDQRTLI